MSELERQEHDPYAASRVPRGLGDEVTGPMTVELVRVLDETRRILDRLGRQAFADVARRVSFVPAQFELDGSGDTAPGGAILYQVPQGRAVQMTRLVLDSAAYNAGAPYVNAGSYAHLYRNQAAVGNLLDFAPVAPGGPWLPGLFEAEVSEAPILKGGDSYVLVVNAGPATTMIGCGLVIVERTEN